VVAQPGSMGLRALEKVVRKSPAELYEVVCERGLEGVVAKQLSPPYRPGERGWIKAKNPSYWRLEEGRETWSGRRATRAPVVPA
jgi:ATP-dependent DNA ligase